MTFVLKPYSKKQQLKSNISDAAKAKAEDARIYGPPGRREWVSQQPCVVSGQTPCENAHTGGTSGGISRKSDYNTIVPLTHDAHAELHRIGVKSFEKKYGVNLTAEAKKTEESWKTRNDIKYPIIHGKPKDFLRERGLI